MTVSSLEDLHARVDQLLPPASYAKLNALLKTNPVEFSVPARVRLPAGTSQRALATLAKDLLKASGSTR